MNKIFTLFLAYSLCFGITGRAQTYCTEFDGYDFFDDYIILDCGDGDGPIYFQLTGEGASAISYDNVECNDAAYFDYNASTNVQLAVGAAYSFDIEAGYEENIVSIWIDFDDNGTFDASEKLVAEAVLDDLALTSIPLSIPPGAALGEHRMRVFGAYNLLNSDALYPCNEDDEGYISAYYGKVLDFTVEILDEPLPVSLISFSGKVIDANNVSLHWKTQDEVNNKGFEIHKSSDGVQFASVGFVPVNKQSDAAVKDYSFVDNDFRQLAFYKLIQVDIDGKKSVHSQVVKVNFDAGQIPVYLVPNPAISYIDIHVGNRKAEAIHIFDVSGKMVKQITNVNEINRIDISDLSPGNYLIKCIGNDMPPQALKFVKQ